MKILHIMTSSRGGAAIAAMRLHKSLHHREMQSAFLSTNLTINYEDTVIKDNFFNYHRPSIFKKISTKIFKFILPTKRQAIENEFEQLIPKMNFEIATLPFSNFKVEDHPLYKEADIINLHWIDGIINYESFFLQCKKPIVWTFHDMNSFLGIFHYKNDEITNQSICKSFDTKIKQIKKNSYANIKKCTWITPSKWLYDETLKSGVFSHFNSAHIPYAIDLEVFKLQDKNQLRAKYDIDVSEFVVLFVADSLKNPRKGFDLLLEALSFLKDKNISVVTVGKGAVPVIDGLKIISLGEIKESVIMAECYSLADVFVLPSREDNLPNVMLESFACGTPMIGFKVGGIAEHVQNNFTGLLVDDLNGNSLANSILTMKQTHKKYDSKRIREYAEDNFNFEKQADSYKAIYTSILN